jgi:hypothetical protein
MICVLNYSIDFSINSTIKPARAKRRGGRVVFWPGSAAQAFVRAISA